MISLGRRSKPSLPPAIGRPGDKHKNQDADNRELDDHSQCASCDKEKQHDDNENDQAGCDGGKHIGAQASCLRFAGIRAGAFTHPLPQVVLTAYCFL